MLLQGPFQIHGNGQDDGSRWCGRVLLGAAEDLHRAQTRRLPQVRARSNTEGTRQRIAAALSAQILSFTLSFLQFIV